MEKAYKIKELDKLLQENFGSKMNISEYSTKSLISLGENYGSLMLALEIKLAKNGLPKEDVLRIVAKLCPPNEYLKEVFDSAISFKKEIAYYHKIFPLLKAFQKSQEAYLDIEFIPKCYGARISLNPNSTVVDDDAVLLLENLKLSGYKVVDRMVGFDLQTTELLLKDLAVFHAVPLAFKLDKPEIFETEILPHLSRNTIFDGLSEEAQETIASIIIRNSEHNPECKRLIPNIKKCLRMNLKTIRNPPPPREPFATINHNDYWVNNTMLKFENNNPITNKMLDFQLIDYGSPANDLLFLLLSSVQMDILEQHYDDFIKLYYNNLIECLKKLNCDTKPFTFELLKEEIDICAKTTQFFHVTMMLKHILAVRGKFKELSEITEKDLVGAHEMSKEYKQKIVQTILYFSKNNWI